MKGTLDTVETLLDDSEMEFFLNNGQAFKKSLEIHTGKSTRRLRKVHHDQEEVTSIAHLLWRKSTYYLEHKYIEKHLEQKIHLEWQIEMKIVEILKLWKSVRFWN